LSSLALALSPHGVLFLERGAEDDGDLTRIEQAFSEGMGAGLFHLGAVEVDTALPPSLAYFRELARSLVAALCGEPDIEGLRAEVEIAPRLELLDELAAAPPPMKGAEYVTAEVLRGLFLEAISWFRQDIQKHAGTVASYLHAKSPLWNLVGRVFFHLAENKGDDDAPFAFLATYTTRVSTKAKPQHRPLGRALEEFAGAGNKKALLALLGPVERATQTSGLVKAMVDSGDIYHPLAWAPDDALAFLREVPSLEASGVVVRIPNWWSARGPRGPQVKVTVGAKAPSKLGADALLDFAVAVTLDGERLTEDELREILKGASGLRFVKGRWVEVDHDRLGRVLDHWKTAERQARDEGVSFLDGMRLLAGVRDTAPDGEPEAEARWSRVEPGAWLASTLEGLRAPERLAQIDPGPALHAELRPYQRHGLHWLFFLQTLGLGGCLADDMGLGKTIQVLALLLVLKAQAKKRRPPSLLVLPASLLGNWVAEAARFAPGLDLVIVHPSADKAGAGDIQERAAGADVVLTTYGTLARATWLVERDWDLVILDEAQAIKNPSAKQTRTVKRLRGRVRFALTGTPVENRLGDLWSLFDFVSPGLLGTAAEFGRVSRVLAKREHQAYAPLRQLVRPYILRRLKTDKHIIHDLPDKTEVFAFCNLTKKQAALYTQAVEDLGRKLAASDGIERRGAVLSALMRFKQICNHPSQWTGDGAFDEADSGKFRRLRELCEPLAARQDKVLVFTQFREMTEPLAQYLETIFGRPGLVLHGNTKVRERQKLVDAFQAETGPPFFVLSIKAGGTGLNLTAASHVIHFDRWWNPAVENQATDRAYRIGQKRNVLVHKFACKGTVEERIDALIAGKQSLSKELLDSAGEIPLTEMSNDALMTMVSLDIRAALADS